MPRGHRSQEKTSHRWGTVEPEVPERSYPPSLFYTWASAHCSPPAALEAGLDSSSQQTVTVQTEKSQYTVAPADGRQSPEMQAGQQADKQTSRRASRQASRQAGLAVQPVQEIQAAQPGQAGHSSQPVKPGHPASKPATAPFTSQNSPLPGGPRRPQEAPGGPKSPQ